MASLSFDVVKAEHPRPVVIGKQFAIAPPADDSPQRLFGLAPVQMVLKLEVESSPRCPVSLPLIEHSANMCSERDEAKEMLAEQTLALFDPAPREHTPRGCQFDRTPFEFGELQDLKRRGNREQVIDFQRKVLGDLGQFGMPARRAVRPKFRRKPPIR